jgi:excisionase family DNA binding protein
MREQGLPMFLTVSEAACLLRTTAKAIYTKIERHQLAGVVRDGRRVLVRSETLLQSLHQQGALSPQGA